MNYVFSQRLCVCALSWSVMPELFATPWIIAHLAPLFMGSSGQEYWSRLPFPPPGNLPNPGITPVSLVSPVSGGRFFTTSTTWEGLRISYYKHRVL